MLEADAKQKWCPVAIVRDNKNVPVSRPVDPAMLPMCLGSACMAWRWIDHARHDGTCGLGNGESRLVQ